MTADVPVTRESLRRLHPISTPRPVSQLPDRVWTGEGWDRIRRGYRARVMDEKGNVFVEGDVLFMHRSWTGHGVYEVSFASATGGGRRIASAVVEADGERCRSMGDEHDCLRMELIISAIVLGEAAVEIEGRGSAASASAPQSAP
ncbi:hypothetical protein [Streptomyces sp. SPB162]|uniref:hypothetical protein n=1 Tax=Streptomyces sp. SPB162 TaxID=2940560 RepID=UPI00240505F4|nr:hypothetical protein [Streptomyces sp. SPB162]MDF9816427.1 hypothetical protein [Streptomyces sp. SPB162]